MPISEMKEWVSIIKDILLAAAALVTIFIGIYGLRAWKRDLIGKEVYAATKKLVVESHLITKAINNLRSPTQSYEKRTFTDDEIKHTTQNERWRISEADVYQARMEAFSHAIKSYHTAKLELRVLVGSRIYEGFLPLDVLLNDAIMRVNDYLDAITDNSQVVFPDSREIIIAQKALYPSKNRDDELSQSIADAREAGEVSLLAYLHRKTIYG